MAVEGLPHKTGAGRARIVCDDCSRDDVVACAYVGNANADERRPNENQARARAIAQGWAYVKNKLRCPACEAKRKVTNMADVKAKRAAKTAPREPTKKERVQIFAMLADVYDMDAECYMQGETDDSVADVLGVMPGWVAEIREAEFGPSGCNEDMETLKGEVADFLEEVRKRIQANTDENTKLIEISERARGYADRLARIEKAVGPRNVKKAGL